MATLGRLQHIELAGFRSIKQLSLDLAPLNILIGANGAGKSNFVSFFTLMNRLAEKGLQLHVRAQLNGADRALYFGCKVTERLAVVLQFPFHRYRATLVPTNDDTLVFEREALLFSGGVTGDVHEEKSQALATSGSGESGLPRAGTGSPAQHLARCLQDWKVYHFHDTSDTARIKGTYSIHATERLMPRGENLAAFLYHIRDTGNYQRIVRAIRRVAPFFQDFVFLPEANDLIRLRWKHSGSDDYFDATMLSDGTLRFICIATLLQQPTMPSMILLDEPELGLHPFAMQLLAAMMRSASETTQIIASTQSVTLANQFGWQDMVVVDRNSQGSQFRRLQEHEVACWMEQYKLGDVWEMNALGGTPNEAPGHQR
ncbi:AAA family ATPase [Massilia sp. CCM 9210]|uniref:AAA family ATPase n=1 Tax=Massilia scottii TaxID=3057166 RepID=UPI002796433D|nr:AAA family ATPase [Massilia sp. CCM 9210]MDQ1813088.1 AAA family ATPase [Massilia sp. CCM 9210]